MINEPDNRRDHVDWSGDDLSGCLLVAIPTVLLIVLMVYIVVTR